MIPFTTKLVLTFFKLVLSPLSPPVGLLHPMFSLLLCLICYCLKIFCRVCPAYFNVLREGVILGEGGMRRCALGPNHLTWIIAKLVPPWSKACLGWLGR